MTIETTITIAVYPDPEYHFEVSAGDTIQVTYIERANKNHYERRCDVTFGSLDEMEAVAKAMLKVIAVAQSTKE